MPGFGRHSAWPRVSDYVVETETDFELFQGQIREVPHAGPLHGRQLGQVNAVLGAYVARGHGVALFLLTRQDADNNFASDISIRKNGTDPDTDDRYLEELAFEIKSTLVPEELEQRARIMARCGVRRIFAIPVTGHPAGIDRVAGPLAEWIPAEDHWRTYRRMDAAILGHGGRDLCGHEQAELVAHAGQVGHVPRAVKRIGRQPGHGGLAGNPHAGGVRAVAVMQPARGRARRARGSDGGRGGPSPR
jgi:hypothetical protein